MGRYAGLLSVVLDRLHSPPKAIKRSMFLDASGLWNRKGEAESRFPIIRIGLAQRAFLFSILRTFVGLALA